VVAEEVTNVGIFNMDFLSGFTGSLAKSLDDDRQAKLDAEREEKRARLMAQLKLDYERSHRVVQNEQGQWVEITEDGNGKPVGTPRVLSESEAKAKRLEMESLEAEVEGKKARTAVDSKQAEHYDEDRTREQRIEDRKLALDEAQARDSMATNAVQRKAANRALDEPRETEDDKLNAFAQDQIDRAANEMLAAMPDRQRTAEITRSMQNSVNDIMELDIPASQKRTAIRKVLRGWRASIPVIKKEDDSGSGLGSTLPPGTFNPK
jgi:hypothetical protein